MTRFLTGLLTILAVATAGFADDAMVTGVHAKPVHVAMFKNGLGLVVARAAVPGAATAVRLSPVPDATLGSFWINWPQHVKVQDIKATQVQTTERVAATNIAELLEAHIGHSVALKLQDDWHHVKIVDIPRRQEGPVIRPRLLDIIPPPPPQPRGDLLLIEDAGGMRAVPRSWVQEMRLDPTNPRATVERPRLENVVQFNVATADDRADWPVHLTYLAQGIAWSPSYVVDISDEQRATFSAKAVIVNDLAPLEDAGVELIAGFPHLQFAHVPSALSLTPLQQMLDQLRRRRRPDDHMVTNVMRQQRALVARQPGGAPTPAMPITPVMGEAAEDLYFYKLGNVTLKKGERGYYPLFAGQVPYEHIHT